MIGLRFIEQKDENATDILSRIHPNLFIVHTVTLIVMETYFILVV